MRYIKNKAILLALLYVWPAPLSAQQQYEYKGLKVGDKAPEVTLVNIKNYPGGTTAKLSDFKGKLIVLDFWDKGCSSCIRAFPEMEKLQDEFVDKIQVLLVARNPEEELKVLFERNPNVKNTRLPILMGDTALHRLFPHMSVPHHAWIDGNGIVIAVTHSENTTKGNIKTFLNTGEINLPIRYDIVDKEFAKEPPFKLLFRTPDLINNIQYSSTILKNVSTNITRLTIIDWYRMILINELIPSGSNFRNVDKIIVEPKKEEHLTRYYPAKNDELGKWWADNSFSLLLQLPKEMETQRNEIMKRELEQFWGIRSYIEDRKAECLILYRITKDDQLKTNGNPEYSDKEMDDKYFLGNVNGMTAFRNIDFGVLRQEIGRSLGKTIGKQNVPVIIDQTGIDRELKFDADIDFRGGITTLNRDLAKYGLGLREETRVVKCLILKEL